MRLLARSLRWQRKPAKAKSLADLAEIINYRPGSSWRDSYEAIKLAGLLKTMPAGLGADPNDPLFGKTVASQMRCTPFFVRRPQSPSPNGRQPQRQRVRRSQLPCDRRCQLGCLRRRLETGKLQRAIDLRAGALRSKSSQNGTSWHSCGVDPTSATNCSRPHGTSAQIGKSGA